MHRPRFRHDYLPIRLAEPYQDHLVVVGETRNVMIDDPVAAELAGMLDGSRALGQVVGELVGRHPAAALARALRRLDGLNLLAAGPCATPRPAAAAWDARGVAPDRAEQWRRDGRVLLVDAGSPAVADLAARLGDLGPAVTVRPIGSPDLLAGDGLVVVAPGSMIDPRLARLNAACLTAGRPWLMVRPHGHVLLLGPQIRPGETGCWECLRRRWTDNEEVINFVIGQRAETGQPGGNGQYGEAGQRGEDDRPSPAWAALDATTAVLAGLLAAELPVLAVAGSSPRVTGRMVSLDTRDLSSGTHPLVRLPQCPACGDPARLGGGGPRVTVEADPLSAEPETGSRTRSAVASLRALDHQVGPYLGVVTRLSATGDDGGGVMFSFTAGHNFALARQPERLRGNLRGLSGGKGRTEVQARVSAIGEAIERYCGVWRADRPTRRATYRSLGRDRAVPMSELRNFSARQFADRDRTNPGAGWFHHVPVPVADDTELEWTTGWSLTHDRPCELPAAHVWYGHPDAARLGLGPADSNGCAAGNTVGEAILQGFYELVERDAVALWWYHRSRLPGVDLDTVDDPWIGAVRRHYRTALGRRLWVLDLTADLPVPVYAAISERNGGGEVLVGFGAHPSAPVALTRAVSELNQFLPLAAAMAADTGGYRGAEPDTARWLTTVRTEDQPWLLPDPGQQPGTPARHPEPAADTSAAVAAAVATARTAGLELIVVDQSRPELELAVVRVVVPGLRHFWRRLGPGRLWEVPAALGRVPRAAGEDSINPLSVFF